MRHLLFLYFLLIYTIGFAALIVTATLYLRERNRQILAFAVYYLAFTLKVVLSGLSVYVGLTLLDSTILRSVHAIDIWATLFLSCAIVSFMRSLFPNPRLKLIEWGFFAAALALLLLNAFLSASSSRLISYLFLAAASAYSLVPSIGFLKSRDSDQRATAIALIVGLAAFAPLIFVPVFLEDSLPPALKNVPPQLVAFPLLYAYHGILLTWYFLRSSRGAERRGIDWLRQVGLSRRELEVVELVAAGESNRAIGEKLFISLPTVKKHLHNVYGKMGIKTRYQLIHRVRR